jgi:cytoskeletal protein CcmA (bactofilin family)
MLLAGCGGDDDDTTAATSGTDPVPATTSTASAGGGPAGRETSPGSCDGSIGAETVENVEVPAGATCRLDGTTVTGNVRVRRDATLDARGVTVDGDVQGENARAVNVTMSSSVDGNIQVEQGGSSNVTRTRTRIDGDLQCESNNPVPTGGDNRVQGDKEEQCARL